MDGGIIIFLPLVPVFISLLVFYTLLAQHSLAFVPLFVVFLHIYYFILDTFFYGDGNEGRIKLLGFMYIHVILVPGVLSISPFL